MTAELTGAWTHWLAHPPLRVWPILSDTGRFNEMSGLPRYTLSETPQPDGSVRRIGHGRVARFDLLWEEPPVEWVAERYFIETRVFLNGPLVSMTAALEMTPAGEGAHCTFRISFVSRYPLLGPYVARRMIAGTERNFAKAVQGADAYLRSAQARAFDLGKPVLEAGGETRAREIAAYLQSGPYDHGLTQLLLEIVTQAPDADACRLRPLALARQWQVEPRFAIEVCLAAVRSGLLRLTWDLLCPRCRGAKAIAPRLELLEPRAHCPSCNVDYDADFSSNVELVFHPGAAVRSCATGEYCLSGPQTTPHVIIQQTLAPGEVRRLEATLAPGDYRLRTLSRGAQCDISYAGGAFPAMVAAGDAIIARDAAAPGMICLVNETGRPLTLLIESREWIRDALSAHQVTTLHTFRHLFPDQVLRPGEEMAIDSVTLMFTDLQGSTALYREIGDGPAYHRVREHFSFLTDIVRAHNGTLVKTIGDAVMAAFSDPAQAVSAAILVQHTIAGFNQGHRDAAINIKLGLHCGRCIVVNLNDRLDYFGASVNLAARLQAQSRGGDIVLSEELAGDPLVSPMLEALDVQREIAAIKGYDRPVPFLRIAKAVRATG